MQVLTGSLNTIFVKVADEVESKNSEGNLARFEHPLIQVASMFLGELCCMLAYFIYKAIKKEETQEAGEGFIKFQNPKHGYLFIIPACCDCCATGMMYFGLLWVSASLFQILRGSLIIFTGLLTVLWLRKKLEWFRWVGMFVILGGLIITGVGETYAPKRCYVVNLTNTSDGLAKMDTPVPNMDTLVAKMDTQVAILHTQVANLDTQLANMDKNSRGASNDTRVLPKYSYVTSDKECAQSGSESHLLIGILLIVAGQVVMAFQGVYEEKILVKYDVNPLLAVGWEGLFGLTILTITLCAMIPYKVVVYGVRVGDFHEAVIQLGNDATLLVCFIGTIISIGFFNFAGMLVTKKMNATTRTVLDSVRTVVVWVSFLSLPFGWELFTTKSLLIKVLGFVTVVSGVFLYNNILFVPMAKRLLKKENE